MSRTSLGVVLLGVGANLDTHRHGSPRGSLLAALRRLGELGVTTERLSPWYSSAPVPPSDQPDFSNAVASIDTCLPPLALLFTLHRVEREMGRRRGVRNAARVIDLDLLSYGDLARSTPVLTLPHPRLAERAFVLRPLCDLMPEWRHPGLGVSAGDLLDQLPPGQAIRRIGRPAHEA